MASKNCEAIGCRTLVLPFTIFCERCWLLVPSDVKRIIERTYRPNAAHRSKACDVAVGQAIQDLLQHKLTGHCFPRDGQFEFDDAGVPIHEEQLGPLVGLDVTPDSAKRPA